MQRPTHPGLLAVHPATHHQQHCHVSRSPPCLLPCTIWLQQAVTAPGLAAWPAAARVASQRLQDMHDVHVMAVAAHYLLLRCVIITAAAMALADT